MKAERQVIVYGMRRASKVETPSTKKRLLVNKINKDVFVCTDSAGQLPPGLLTIRG
jgi:hypothetical protein